MGVNVVYSTFKPVCTRFKVEIYAKCVYQFQGCCFTITASTDILSFSFENSATNWSAQIAV